MPDKIEAVPLREVATIFLPLFQKAIRNYEDLLNLDPAQFEGNNKNYKAYYDACKAAVSHLQLLLKLVEWAEVPVEKGDFSQEELGQLLISLQAECEAEEADFDGDDGEMA